MTDQTTPRDDRHESNRWENERVVYQAQRDHELELNKATAAFEHATVSPLFLLNGGGAIAFLTLLGTTNKSASPGFGINLMFAVIAVSLWAMALVAAAVAVQGGYDAQRNFERGSRGRRELIEAQLEVGDTFRGSLSKPSIDPGTEVAKALQRQKAWKRWIKISLGGFIAGVAAAAASVLL